MSGARIVCLLPVRNAAAGLPEWLDEAGRFADAVVALDDGSTDGTAAVLRAHPLVVRTLVSPPRDGHLGWHDGRNRNRLLAAAGEFAPDWIVWLDADERLDEEDAAALRRFVVTEALTPCAYAFQVYRMVGEHVHDPVYQWVFRLFRYAEGQRIPNRRLDVVPVPTTIPRPLWVPTTIRLKHFGEAHEADRRRRVAKYREADPEGVFREYYDRLPPLSIGPFRPWQRRDPSTPLLHAAPRPAATTGEAARPTLVCLLPARDCVDLLLGWFESVARFADAIVALDDGSVDETGTILRAHPLVARVLTSPVRGDYAGWDDGENRNRLLAAAAEMSPDWIISIDADERMPLEDGVALRRFLRDEAQPGVGYGFRSYRMIGDEDHFDRADYDAYRLFAFEPGQVFPTDRLHAPPIPTSIPRVAWRLTTIRMKHLAALTEDHRRARWDKYRQADPARDWEPDYEYTVRPAEAVRPWPVRSPDLPFLHTWAAEDAAAAALDLEGPALTVVVVTGPGDERAPAERLVELLGGDRNAEGLVVTRDPYAAEVLRRSVPGVTVVAVDPTLSEAELRNAAVGHARGDYVSFGGEGDRFARDDLKAIVAAHDEGHAVVGVPLVAPLGSAVGLAGFILSAGLNDDGAVDYVSFAREPLQAIGGFDAELDHGWAALAARVLADLGLTTTVIEAPLLPPPAAGGVVGLLRRQYRLGQGLSRGRAAIGDAGPADGFNSSPGRRPVPAGATARVGGVADGMAALGAAATRLGAARERQRTRTPPMNGG